MTGKLTASMEVTGVDDMGNGKFRVWAHSNDSTLLYDTPWPPAKGEFLVVSAEVASPPKAVKACRCGCTCYYCEGGHDKGAPYCVFGHASYCARRKP